MTGIHRIGVFVATLGLASGAMGQEDVAQGQKLFDS